MINKILTVALCCFAAMGTTSAGAIADAAVQNTHQANRKGFGIYVDQDVLIPALNEDRDYTMGVAFEFFGPRKPKPASILDATLEKINRKIFPAKKMVDYQRSLLLGSVNFTPDDLANPDPIFNDRPYASLLYLSSKRVISTTYKQKSKEHKSKHAVLGVELQVGMLGLDIADTVQTKIHGYMRSAYNRDEPVDPKGWHHQISDGGEPTIKCRVSFGEQILRDSHWDLAYTADASVGYQTNASLGLQARLGLTDSGFWTLPYDPINRGNFLPSIAGNEIYVWAAYRARGAIYDALLQGQFRDGDVTFSGNDIKRLLHEAGVGLTFAYKAVQFTFSRNFKSAELKGSAARSHFWGGLYFMFRW